MKHLLASVIAGLLLIVANAEAAQKNLTFTNGFTTNHIMLWTDDPATTDIVRVDLLNGMNGWRVTTGTGADTLDVLAPTLPPIDPATGGVKVKFQYTGSLSFQWAELFFDGINNNLLGAGAQTWSGGWVSSAAFTHLTDIPDLMTAGAAMPLPHAVVLMLSAVVFLGCTYRAPAQGVRPTASDNRRRLRRQAGARPPKRTTVTRLQSEQIGRLRRSRTRPSGRVRHRLLR